MSNIFDQFDEKPKQNSNDKPVNIFDQFDESPTPQGGGQSSLAGGNDRLQKTLAKADAKVAEFDQPAPAKAEGKSLLGQFGDQLKGQALAAQQGLTLGFADEITGVAAALDPTKMGAGYFDNMGQRYEQARDTERQVVQDFRDENPIASTVAEMAGSIATPVGVVGGATKAARTGQLALQGAGLGGTQAAGTSNEAWGSDEFNQDVITGMGAGAVLNPAVSGALSKGADLLSKAHLGKFGADRAAKASIGDELRTIQQNDPARYDAIKREIAQGGDNAVLADVEELGQIARQSTAPTAPADAASLKGRQASAYDELTNAVSPKVDADNLPKVAGVQVQKEDLLSIDGSGSYVNPKAYAETARKQYNTEAAPLYDEAYQAIPTSAQTEAFDKLMQARPAIADVYETAVKNAAGLTPKGQEPTQVRIYDEVGRLLAGNQAGGTASKAARARAKDELDALVYGISPTLKDARAIAQKGQQAKENVSIGSNIFKAKDADINKALKQLQKRNPDGSLDVDATKSAFEQVRLGAYDAMREKIRKATDSGTDIKTKRLLKEHEISNFAKLTQTSAEDLGLLVGNVSKAKRTSMLADKAPVSTKFDALAQILPTNAQGMMNFTALASFASNPSGMGALALAGRFGQAKVSSMNKEQLGKAIKGELFKVGVKPADLDKLLSGDFGSIPKERIRQIAQGVGRMVSGQTTKAVTQANDSNAALTPHELAQRKADRLFGIEQKTAPAVNNAALPRGQRDPFAGL